MGTRPRTKFVLQKKARRCGKCGAKVNTQLTRCKRCAGKLKMPKK